MVVVLVVVGPELTTHNSTHTHSLTLTAADGRAIVVVVLVVVVAVVLVPREQQHSQADNTETGQKGAECSYGGGGGQRRRRRGEERRGEARRRRTRRRGNSRALARSLSLSLPPAFLSLPFPLPLYGSSLCSLRSSSSSFPWALEVVVVWLAGSLQQKCEGTE